MSLAEKIAESAKSDDQFSADLNVTAQCLWLAAAGKWHEAHALCDDIPEPGGSWIHAYLHREEGDLGNAAYWYSRAQQPVPKSSVTLKEEWMQIAKSLLD